MILRSTYSQAIWETVRRGATLLSPDVEQAFERAIAKETSPSAKSGLQQTLTSMHMSAVKRNPLCPDTGWPLFYVQVGNECSLEGGIMGLEEAGREAVIRATKEGYLRATMKHPLTGFDPGNNIGANIPHFTYKFVEGKDITVTYVAKGGGSECFGGTRHRVVAFADGLAGIQKCVVDNFIASARAGAICPPNVLGIGIGGTANVAAELAKEAACLRTVGSHHPDPEMAQLEKNLYEALNDLGIGMMGVGGDTSVLAVHVEYAYTHIAGIVVSTSSNCMVARRATTRICADQTTIAQDAPMWFGDR